MVELVNSALSLWGNFTPCFLPAKVEAKNGKRSGFHQAEGMIPALHGDAMFTKGRVRAGDLLGPGPASPGFAPLCFTSSALSSPLPSRNCRISQHQELAPSNCSRPLSGDKHHRGFEANNAHRMWGCKQGCKPTSPRPMEGGCPGPGRRVLIPAWSFGIQGDISTRHTAWGNELSFTT